MDASDEFAPRNPSMQSTRNPEIVNARPDAPEAFADAARRQFLENREAARRIKEKVDLHRNHGSAFGGPLSDAKHDEESVFY